MTLPDGWTVTGLIQWGLVTAVILFVINVLFESNVRNFIEERGWDKLLSKTWVKMKPLTTRRGFWFAFGLTAGGALVAWLLPILSVSPTVVPANSDHHVSTAPQVVPPLSAEETQFRIDLK